MLDLSPTKLLIIFVVAVVLLGPKRLPHVARQLGAGWRKIREMRDQFDTEIRRSVPDLPTSQEIAHFARSPLRMLDRLADLPDARASRVPGTEEEPDDVEAIEDIERTAAAPKPTPPLPARPPVVGGLSFPTFAGVDTDDPSLN